MTRQYLATLLVLAILLIAGSSYAQDEAAIFAIADVLRKDNLSGSLQYRGRCGKQDDYITRGFPITTFATSGSGPALQIVREMFSKDAEMQVTQAPGGIIRMVEKGTPEDLLNVNIEHLRFDEWQKKNALLSAFPNWVQEFIVNAPEVKSFMKEHNIVWAPIPRELKGAGGTPSVLGELDNVTLSQALDYMADTFHGLWVYKECLGNNEDRRVVDLWFYR